MSLVIRELYEEYARGAIGRREFIGRLARLAGGMAAAAALLPALEAGGAAQAVPKDDPRLEAGYVKYPVEGGEMRAYQARPKGAGKLAGVVVIHENRGLNPHTEDMVRRVALEGFTAVAPDALSPFGGTPEKPRRGPAPFRQARPRGQHQELRSRRGLSQDRAAGDGRKVLTTLEVAVALAVDRAAGGRARVLLADAEAALGANALRYGADHSNASVFPAD